MRLFNIGIKLCPTSVNEYSTLGGISAYNFLFTSPSASRVFNVSVRTFGEISGIALLIVLKRVDLFSESTLNTLIGGKSFSRNSKSENDKYYGKAIFADYVMKNYQKIDFSNFVPFLDSINSVLDDYQKNNLIRPQ